MAGRKALWDEMEMDNNLILVEGWARDGATEKQISENLKVSIDTLQRWKKSKSGFSTALKKGKEIADRQVENALFKRAIGYEYDEITQEGGVETKRVRKQVAPDVTAQIFWLKNRKPEMWRDKKEIDQTVANKDGLSFKIESMTAAEREARIDELIRKREGDYLKG